MGFGFILLAGSVHADQEWATLKGENFIIYYRPDVTEDFAKTVLDSAEDGLRQVYENLGLSAYQNWASDKRVSIYVYSDQNDYVSNGGQAGWSHGAALIYNRAIKTFPADAGFFDAILPHELGHIVLHMFVGPYASIPLWFDEGVAMYQEKAKHIGAAKVVQEALLKGQFIPLNQLTVMRLYSNSPRETVELFYSESASIVNFMITQLGEGHFYQLCRELKGNISFEDALAKVYINIGSLDDLNKKWVEFLKGRT